VVRPLNGLQVQEVIAGVTGRKARKSLPDEAVAGLDPIDLAVAIRPGSNVTDCEARLRKLTAARVVRIGDDVPRLEDLSGCDDAREYRLVRQANDVEGRQAGRHLHLYVHGTGLDALEGDR
jgi:hypothetical protein